jgi:hypothetical protein
MLGYTVGFVGTDIGIPILALSRHTVCQLPGFYQRDLVLLTLKAVCRKGS